MVEMLTRGSAELAPASRKAPTLVLMAGFAGAGKTTLATWLSQRLQMRVLNKDDLKRQRLARGEDVELAGWYAFEELFQLIEEEVVRRGNSVIIDTSNEKPFIFGTITQLIEQLKSCHIQASLRIILCNASKETRTTRLVARGSVFEPHYHELPTILDDSELPIRFEHLPSDKRIVLKVDTNPPLLDYAGDVLDWLESPEA